MAGESPPHSGSQALPMNRDGPLAIASE
jgi:hypothetical protein